MEFIENNPDADRLIHGLRDTGYSFNTAAADIVDNSIAAGATQVSIDIVLEDTGRRYVFFGDNGHGMNEADLLDALRYGAPKRSDEKSLGKFGLGLKTASSSICKRFDVISRKSSSDQLAKLGWDVDVVAEQNAWVNIKDSVTPEDKENFSEYCGEKGTLVVWSNCDQLLGAAYKKPGGSQEQRAITNLTKKLKEHLALTYHKFLFEDDDSQPNIKIFLNGEAVEGFNPFYEEKSDQILPASETKIPIETENGEEHVAHVHAWILPHRKTMSNAENDKFAKLLNRNQGFYIYREGRLISAGGWHGMFALEDHYKCYRVQLEFGHELDEAFKVDVKKSRIIFDPELETFLKSLLQPGYREANARYRGYKAATAKQAKVDHGTSSIVIKNESSTKQPAVISSEINKGDVLVSNNMGSRIQLKVPPQKTAMHGEAIKAVSTITSGMLWEPSFETLDDDSVLRPSALLNEHHDFYQKIYKRCQNNPHATQGMDFLIWTLAAAELNNKDNDLNKVFEDIREEVSGNLRKLLRDLEMPDEEDLEMDI
ncbi:ATP-binding protein [Porticoccaceae bacterium]|nr:ATP-binding protein [Porticoccaceae bacterium]